MYECGTTNTIGHPELPRLEIKYVIPLGKQVSRVNVTDSLIQTLQENYYMYPNQRDVPIGDTISRFVDPNPLVYSSGNLYFRNTIEFVGHFYEFGYHVALFYIYPLNYIPSQHKLIFCSSLSFTIQLSDSNSNFPRPKKESRRMFEVTKKLVTSSIRNVTDFNSSVGGPSRIVETNEKISISLPLLQNSLEVLPEYIVITNDTDIHGNEIEPYNGQTMTNVFQTFADWKTKKGIPTVVVTIDDICANYSGNDIQSKIHDFLADVYQEYGTMYVLFGGDVNVVPERMSDTITLFPSTQYENRFSFPTDLYYTAIETSWDSNGNGFFGEFPSENGDITDNTPDFLYGRIPVENSYEAAIFLSKALTYENMANIGNRNYVNNVMMMAGMLNNSQSGYQSFVRNHGDAALGVWIKWNNGITKTLGIINDSVIRWRLFEDFYVFDDTANNAILHSIGWDNHSPYLCRNNVIGALGTGFINTSNNEFPHLVFHTDHSSYLSLGTSTIHSNETIDRIDVDGLLNAPYYHILMTQGCSPGEFQKDCIIERFLNNPNGGSVAVLASASTSYRNAEAYYQTGFLSSCYNFSRINTEITSASLYNIGNIYYSVHQNAGNDEMGVFIKRKNHLFGDPELPIWTREPVDLTVTTTPPAITNQDNQLTVSVSGMAYSEYATNDVYVCVMKDGEVYLRQHYDGTAHNHDFVFEDVKPETLGELKVTVTGHNYIPYETTIPVTITGKNVYISEKSVVDATGNGDGNLDAGESDNLSITLKNNGTVSLTNVTATLSCEFLDENLNQSIDDYLIVVTSAANYGTIAQNATVTRNDFQLALSNAIPDRTPLRCTLTVSDGSGVVGERSFTLLVRAPEIEYVSVRHEERPNGRIVLDIELNNLGFGMAKGVAATLASPSSVQITQGSATYGEMDHLESKTESFEFVPNGNIDNTHFTLTIIDAYNKSWSFDFVLHDIIGTIENLMFTNTEHSIKLKWNPIEGSRGYYVYRSMTANGNYERLNSYPVPSAVYPDLGLAAKQTYYYGVSYLDEYGNESEKARITAWTSLPIAEGWPVSIPDDLGRAWGTAPNVADINNDGNQEIFLTTGVGDQRDSIGAILSFNNQGEELYDIDHNPTTISGFANLHISMTCTPAIGDIDNDGIIEVVVATRCDKNDSNYKLCVYKNVDADNDGTPDLAWEHIPLDFKNFNGVVLADLNDDGTLEIIAPNQGRSNGNTHVEVFDCLGSRLYDISIPPTYNIDQKAVTMPIVADFDNDGHKEIVFGLEGGVYLWSSHATPQLFPLVSINGERTDCPVIATDIDGDGDLEILYMAIKNGNGYVRAINTDGTSVTNWSGDTHLVPLSNTSMDWAWPPYFCVADIDNDGSIEVFVADGGVLKMWDNEGNMFGIGEIHISDLDCRYFQPVIADVDGNGDCEIVIPSQNGYIYAYKPNGDVVPGWPLAVVDLATIPAITDIDGDGYNEVIAAAQTELYVWHTEGESKYNQWDRFRYNKHNNAVYEIPCSYNEVPLEITSTQVWNDDRHVNRDVIVNNGAQLTIKSEMRLSEDSKIIVKPGGRLILDGCKLTCSCPDEMWQGIEVWGNKNAHQYEVNGSYQQGYVELKNGATVENAVCALALWRPNHWTTTGGIVKAADAVFRNNQRSVHALYYKNFNPITNKETDYQASFTRCQFVIDDDYLGDEDRVFHKHVDLNHVRGLKFQACDFSVSAPSGNISQWTSGIAGYEAGFSVSGWCENNYVHPCPSMDSSSFTGFFTAVGAVNVGAKTPPAVTVSHATFSKNDFGVYANNLGNVSVTFCDFDVKRQGNWPLCGAGVLAENMYNFLIEENAFAIANSFGGESYGTIVKDCAVQGKVYRNGYERLFCGNLAWGRNILMKSSNNYLGLEYGCNTNIGNVIDFYVLGEDGVFSGIQSSQGSSLTAARNTFSADGYHFYNGGDHKITYYYYDVAGFDNEKPLNYNEKVILDHTNQTDNCPSNFGYGVDPVSHVLTLAERQQREQEYYDAHASYHGLKAVYDSRIDGGSTDDMMNDIASATASDMWALRAQLLGASPYLTSPVLTATSDRDDVFTESVLFEILLSNPEELKKDSLMDHLRNKANPLPQYMMDILDQVANGSSARTVMENRLSAYRGTYTRAAGDIVRSLVNDTVVDLTELRGWLASMEDIHADRDIIATYVDEGDFTSALALANMLPTLYGLAGNDLTEHDDYVELLELYHDLYADGRNTMQLDSTERVQVGRIAEYGTGYPRSMAQAILHGTDWESYSDNPFDCPTLTLPEGDRGGKAGGYTFTQEDLSKAMGMSINVNPNPATTWTVVDFILPANATKATINVTNALGIAVFSSELNGNQGQKVLDLRHLSDGVYVYTVQCGEYVQTGKLVITK